MSRDVFGIGGVSASLFILLLKTLNIRTIFDLERAVRSVSASLPQPRALAAPPAAAAGADADTAAPAPDPAAAAQPAPAAAPVGPDAMLVTVIGRVLLRDTKRDSRLRRSFDLGGHPIDLDGKAPDSATFVATTKALVEVKLDDLHVHRLRQIWKHIADRLQPQKAQL